MHHRRSATMLLTAAVLVALTVGAGAGSAGARVIATAAPTLTTSSVPHGFKLGPAPRHAAVPGQLIVEYAGSVGIARLERVADPNGAATVRRLSGASAPSGHTIVLVSSSTLSTSDLRRRFAADPAVVAVSPNYYRHAMSAPVPNDPGVQSQWALNAIDLPDAWHVSTGSSNVVVASIDTGVSLLHPDLVDNLWHNSAEIPGNHIDDDHNGYVDDVYGIDTVNHDSVPMDDYGHGTHTSAIMAGVTDNGIGVAGVCPQARIMSLKFLNSYGWGTDAAAIECVDYVIHERLDHGVNVVAINASWGGGQSNLVLRNEIAAAGDAGIVFCAAAGNEGNDNDFWSNYPSGFDCPNIIAVAATDVDGWLTFWSNYGLCTVDIAAPGDDIVSAVLDGAYERHSGTSMATPYVTGTVALCAAAYPGETVAQRIDRILSTARPSADLAGTSITGGRLDVAAALGLAAPGGDTTAPVTTALGVDTAVHDIPVDVCFWADDGSGGSGVATTEWRLAGDSEWQTTADAFVVPPRKAIADRTVEYRSTDRAGNVEATQQVTIHFDTTARADDRYPGVPLPPSPVAGGVSPLRDFTDMYRVRLHAGESLRATVTGPPGSEVDVTLRRLAPRPSHLSGVIMRADTSFMPSLAYRAPVAGTYFLTLRPMGYSEVYGLTWEVVADGVDVVPPRVAAEGAPLFRGRYPGWTNQPVTLTFSGRDGAAGSGIAGYESSADDGLSYQAGDTRVVDAPADHSGDGWKDIRVRAADNAGNVSAVLDVGFGIDTRGPATSAQALGGKAITGGVFFFGYDITDLTDFVHCQLVVQEAATHAVVQTKDLGMQRTEGNVFWPGATFSHIGRFTIKAPPGTYDLLIAGATTDEAGNLWESAVCTKQLVVK